MPAKKDHIESAKMPPMSATEFTVLRESIRTCGQQQPIVLYKDQIIDGRHRHKACLLEKIDPWFATVTDAQLKDDGITLSDYVWALNVPRRHLSKTTLAQMAAARLARMVKEKGEPKTSADTAQVAADFKVSRESIRQAALVEKQGVAKLRSAVTKGTITLPVAAKLATKPKTVQSNALADGAAAIKAALRPNKSGASIQTIDNTIDGLMDQLGRALDSRRGGSKRHTNQSRAATEAWKQLGEAIKQWRKT